MHKEEVDERGMGKTGFEGYGYLYKAFEESHECNIMHNRIHQLPQAETGETPWNSIMADLDGAERPASGSNQTSPANAYEMTTRETSSSALDLLDVQLSIIFALHDALFAQPSHELHHSLRNQPLPRSSRDILCLTFRQHQRVNVLPPGSNLLSFPLPLPKMDSCEIRRRSCSLSIPRDVDGLCCESVLGGDVLEALSNCSGNAFTRSMMRERVLGVDVGCEDG